MVNTRSLAEGWKVVVDQSVEFVQKPHVFQKERKRERERERVVASWSL